MPARPRRQGSIDETARVGAEPTAEGSAPAAAHVPPPMQGTGDPAAGGVTSRGGSGGVRPATPNILLSPPTAAAAHVPPSPGPVRGVHAWDLLVCMFVCMCVCVRVVMLTNASLACHRVGRARARPVAMAAGPDQPCVSSGCCRAGGRRRSPWKRRAPRWRSSARRRVPTHSRHSTRRRSRQRPQRVVAAAAAPGAAAQVSRAPQPPTYVMHRERERERCTDTHRHCLYAICAHNHARVALAAVTRTDTGAACIPVQAELGRPGKVLDDAICARCMSGRTRVVCAPVRLCLTVHTAGVTWSPLGKQHDGGGPQDPGSAVSGAGVVP
jgi:hypothetical protein